MMCTNQEENCFKVLAGISVLESPELQNSRGFLPNVCVYVCLSSCMQRYRLRNRFPRSTQQPYHCKSIQTPTQNGQESQ